MKMHSVSTTAGEILGIGVDLVDGRRIEKALLRHPTRFALRVFTEQERAYASAQNIPMLSYAKRFAAKEAFAKATGLGIGKMLGWKDIELVSQPGGQPTIDISHRCVQILQDLWQGSFRTMVSLSDESPYAQAFVVIVRCRDVPNQDARHFDNRSYSCNKNMNP
jgi:holo-[acyl-carrier protein] synthase